MSTLNKKDAVYFKNLTIENLNCFKEEHFFDFTNKNDEIKQWTVFLGNNNTGKTTILRALAGLEPEYFGQDGEDEIVPSIIFDYDKIFFKIRSVLRTKNKDSNWYFSYNTVSKLSLNGFETFYVTSYGTRRKSSSKFIADKKFVQKQNSSLFDDNIELTNIEEWLLQLDYSIKNNSEKAKKQFSKVKEVLTSDVLPDITNFRFVTDDNLDNYVLFKTDFGEVRYYELGYGYQATLAWIADLMKKMFERYPNSDNPLHEPAVVLIDEIDLHLHPEWQRKIIHFVGNLFPNVQFIATTHSPLVVQSADDINVIVLQKDDDNIIVKQPEFSTFKGWTVEEILSELMELGEKTKSEQYLDLIKQFDEALDKNNKENAQKAYNELDKILHPDSSQRKLLKIQMTALTSQND